MKRDRRGRFLPAGRAAAPPETPEPPPPTGAPREARARRAGGRRRPAAREEPEPRAPRRDEEDDEEEEAPRPPPEPERWASPAPQAAGLGRDLTTGYCRLCHGKFSSRSLRNAFGKVPVTGENAEKQRRLEQVFFADFQRLVGVAARQDPSLPQFVCKKCHAQFYKCRGVLKAFIQKVNLSPAGHLKPQGKSRVGQPLTPAAEEDASSLADLITSSPQCLRRLVVWAHGHAENCRLVPSLQSVLSSEYHGIVQAVWGCGEGHNYVMSTDSDRGAPQGDSTSPAQWELNQDASEHVASNGIKASSAGTEPQPQHSPVRTASGQLPSDSGSGALPALNLESQVPESHDLPSSEEVPGATSHVESPRRPACPLNGSPGLPSEKLVLPEAVDERVKDEFSDLSEGDSFSEEEGENGKGGPSSDDFFQIYAGKRKAESPGGKSEEPKVRKKPGPKPGWKKKIKFEREELPTIYKCPYQGCTAVYRGADGMKKHIKEHHEEVRERPCPHPGCNKVFMIDRYLQRHVKLIHTEVRNYICDECGHTFKQRKHLSVHQMRHSGAKPLQCEICGFQCRQRASLKYHMTKHKAEAELEFACDQCGKRFEKAHNLNVHMSMVHPLTQAQDKPKAAEAEHGPVPAARAAPAADAASPGTAKSRPVKVELCAQQREPT